MMQIYRKTHVLRWHILLPLCLLLFTQCTTAKLSMQEGKQIDQLGVCLVFGEEVPPEFQEQFESKLDAYIVQYNAQPHPFKLIDCQDESSLLLRIENVQYTTPQQRTAGLAVSAIGILGVPVAMVSAGLPFYAFFYYFPANETQAVLALSQDIAHPTMGTMNRVYTSGGMFGTDERQRLRHSSKFEKHLTAIFVELETSYIKTSKKPAAKIKQQAITADLN
ncbi:hypothetical protein [uncultured Pontibacter sp.]|uniref:hypothetical protein n=1 Tax=uncultured Pontibacter sp. TaxID=453356 RepID=UPI00261A56CD|nr:hypothetical protein [uncultured Pontibacter sp.]